MEKGRKKVLQHKEMLEVAKGYWNTNDITLYLPPDKKEEYNKEPVTWCAACKSLRIVNCDTPLDITISCYCDSCGCIDTHVGTIKEWEEAVNNQYNNN